jgi:hypothetical protein
MRLTLNKFIIIFFICSVLIPKSTNALTISPARFEIETDPGSEVRGEVILMNEQSEVKTFYSSFENFEANGDSGTPNFVPGNEGLASWMTTEPSVTLNPGEEKTVSFNIKVPSDARPGGHFAALFFGTNKVNSAESNISVGARIGMLVLLRVSGEVKEDGGISDVGTESKEIIFSKLPVVLTYTFNNNGDDRLNPKGKIIIRNIFGIKVEELNANPSDGNILPKSSRKYKINWGQDAYTSGFFKSALYELRHFAFGPYKVTVDVAYGAKGELRDKESKFIWFVPWQLITIVFLLLIFSWMIFVKIVKTRRRFARKQKELEEKIKELERKSKELDVQNKATRSKNFKVSRRIRE